MEAENQTREELINGLNYVKTQIEKILSVTNRQIEIVANFREEKQTISTSDTKGKLKIAFICLYIVFVLDNIIISYISRTPVYFIISLLCGAIFFFSKNFKSEKKRKERLRKLSVVSFGIYMIWVLFVVFTSGTVLLIIFNLLMIAASIYLVVKLVKKKNQKIEEENKQTAEYNARVQQEYDETVEQLNQLKNDLYTQSGYWYPKDYYSLEAATFFLSAVENYKADTIKEIVLLFDDTQYKNEMLNSQRAIQQMSEQQLINQGEMIKQLKFANVLNVANLALNVSTLGAIRQNTDAVNANSYAVNSAADRTASAMGDATNAANRAAKASEKAANMANRVWKKL